MRQPYLNSLMASLLAEPAYTATGINDDTIDQTVIESKVFLRSPGDEDSDVVFARTIEMNASDVPLTISTWAITNAPTITDITTDQDDDATLSLTGPNVLTITGENFGAEDADLEVLIFTRQKVKIGCIAPTPFKNRLRLPATITAVSGGDDEITATITFEPLYGYDPAVGPCEVVVFNKKRLLVSDEFNLAIV
jgi:hypothetical protein